MSYEERFAVFSEIHKKTECNNHVEYVNIKTSKAPGRLSQG